MSKVMAAMLLAATALAPVAADAQDWGRRGGDRGGEQQAQQQAGGGRQDGQGQPAAQAAPQPQAFQPQAQPQSRPGGAGYGGRNRYGYQGQRGGYAGQPGGPPAQAGDYRGRPGGYAGQPNGGAERAGRPGQWPEGARDDRGGYPGDRRPGGYRGGGNYQDYAGRGGYPGAGGRGPGGYGGPGYGNPGYGYSGYRADRRDFGRDQARFAGRAAWNLGWRNDSRYDWGDYRRSHYGLFRLPRYEAPYGYGYGYRRFGIGATLNSILFAEDYWINDPYDYRLPPAYGPYRWVRYYGDALLVDVESGEVVDTVYGIFG